MSEQHRKTLLSPARTLLATSTSERERSRRCKQSFDDMTVAFSDRSGRWQSVPDGDNDVTYGSLRQCEEDGEEDDSGSSGDEDADEVQSQFFSRMKKKSANEWMKRSPGTPAEDRGPISPVREHASPTVAPPARNIFSPAPLLLGLSRVVRSLWVRPTTAEEAEGAATTAGDRCSPLPVRPRSLNHMFSADTLPVHNGDVPIHHGDGGPGRSSVASAGGLGGLGGGNDLFSDSSTFYDFRDGGAERRAAFWRCVRNRSDDFQIHIAACFLADYEHSRRPALPPDVRSIAGHQLLLHRVRFSHPWFAALSLAAAVIFASSHLEDKILDLEGPGAQTYRSWLAALTVVSVVVFAADLGLMRFLSKSNDDMEERYYAGTPGSENHQRHKLDLRESRSSQLAGGLLVFLCMYTAETVTFLCREKPSSFVLIGFFKPLLCFYISKQCRNALEALIQVVPIVTKVLLMEFFLNFIFGTFAHRLFGTYAAFDQLDTSFLSMLTLSTTVVNPSLWLPMYRDRPTSAIFFITFLFLMVIIVHSLVLSVIFQSYSQATQHILARSHRDKEDALQLAFESVCALRCDARPAGAPRARTVYVHDVMNVLRVCRPHYPLFKIDALLGVVDPTTEGMLSYNTFRIRVPQALQISLRSPYARSAFVALVEQFSVAVALINIVFVVLVSSAFDSSWLEAYMLPVGGVITLLSLSELVLRLNPWKLFSGMPKARWSPTFDVISILSVLISLIGLVSHLVTDQQDVWNTHSTALDFLFLGRIVDTMRFLKLFKICRDIIHRCEDVLPALAGPLVLLFCGMHLLAYVGMFVWRGRVTVGEMGPDIAYLYDMNNFNGYLTGLVTVFQTVIVNDWNKIADVFLTISNPILVYVFFIGSNLLGVNILLNVLIAFFVGAFVTKYEESEQIGDGKLQKLSFGMETKKSTRIRSHNSDHSLNMLREELRINDDSETSLREKINIYESQRNSPDNDSVRELEMFQREGYEKVIETVVGGVQDEIHDAKEACAVLKAVEKLTPSSEKIGNLVSCYKSLSRFANGHFEELIRSFGQEGSVHRIVSDMHTELIGFHSLLPSEGGGSQGVSAADTVRREVATELRGKDVYVLELSATTLSEGSSLALFVGKVIKKNK